MPRTAKDRLRVEFAPTESVTVRTGAKLPGEDADPRTLPLASTLRPGPPESAHLYGGTPPATLKDAAMEAPAAKSPRLPFPLITTGRAVIVRVRAAEADMRPSLTMKVTWPLEGAV